jgi:hypothetical protein
MKPDFPDPRVKQVEWPAITHEVQLHLVSPLWEVFMREEGYLLIVRIKCPKQASKTMRGKALNSGKNYLPLLWLFCGSNILR